VVLVMTGEIEPLEDDEAVPALDDAQIYAADMLPRITKAYQAWDSLKEYQKEERGRLKEILGARTAALKEAMEVGHKTVSDQVLKLTVAENRWQELEEARAELKDVMGALKDQIKAAAQKIKDLINEAKASSQMSLFTTGGVDTAEKEQE
jgi:hypothetical protein